MNILKIVPVKSGTSYSLPNPGYAKPKLLLNVDTSNRSSSAVKQIYTNVEYPYIIHHAI